MRVHGSTLSPFVRKVMVFAGEKGLEVEHVNVDPGPKSAEFLAISPFGKIPAFEDGDYRLCDSSAIVHYIEACYPAVPLIPTEPRARGRTIWYEELADTIMFSAAAPVFFNRIVADLMGLPSDPAAADAAIEKSLPPVMAYLESAMPDSGFLVEDRLTLADIAVAGPFANLLYCDVTVDAGRYPKLVRFVDTMFARPSFAALIEKDQRFLKR